MPDMSHRNELDAKARREAAIDNGSAVGLTVAEATDLWPIGRSTMYVAIKSGGLRSYKVGRRRVLFPADIDAWIRGETSAAA
jgi:excisionase family DNA binding protein